MPSATVNQLSLLRTPTPYPETKQVPFLDRIFGSGSRTSKSARHIPASNLPPATHNQQQIPSSAGTPKLKFSRTLSIPTLARTPTPYPAPNKRKISFSSIFSIKSNSGNENPQQHQPQKRNRKKPSFLTAKFHLTRSPTPYPVERQGFVTNLFSSFKKRKNQQSKRPQIVVLKKEPMRLANASLYEPFGSSPPTEEGPSCSQGVSASNLVREKLISFPSSLSGAGPACGSSGDIGLGSLTKDLPDKDPCCGDVLPNVAEAPRHITIVEPSKSADKQTMVATAADSAHDVISLQVDGASANVSNSGVNSSDEVVVSS